MPNELGVYPLCKLALTIFFPMILSGYLLYIMGKKGGGTFQRTKCHL
jgi:hypothetical protein